MSTVNVHDAKTHFSRLLNRVKNGEEVIIAKAGRPVARLVPLSKKINKRTPGSAKGRILLKDNFLKPLPSSILNDFEK